jgi:hypothetical protein
MKTRKLAGTVALMHGITGALLTGAKADTIK